MTTHHTQRRPGSYGARMCVPALLLTLSCLRSPVAPPAVSGDPGALAVKNVRASYQPEQDLVRITWEPPAKTVSGYKVYRLFGIARNKSFEPTSGQGNQRRVAGARTDFEDVPGLANGIYSYAVSALAADGADTLEGPVSEADTVMVGSRISFSINSGALFTVNDTCELVLADRTRRVDSVYFGDSLIESTVATGSARRRNSGVVYHDTLTSLNRFAWILPSGAGTKHVWARIVLLDGTDSIYHDDVEIAPFRVRFKLRNDHTKPDWSMFRDPVHDYKFTIFRPCVEFSLSTFCDSTFAKGFDYWLAVGDSVPDLPERPSRGSGGMYWLETQPIGDSLTGLGADHDDTHIYRYCFSPDSAQGAANLAALKRTREVPASAGRPQSEPGAFWGARNQEEVRLHSDRPNTPQENYDYLLSMNTLHKQSKGSKEFTIVARFRGRYFGEVRTVVSTRVLVKEGIETHFDFYPPGTKRHDLDYRFPADGATIKGPFSISLNDAGWNADGLGGYAYDGGGGGTAGAKLIISRMPDSLAGIWNFRTTPGTLTLDHILAWPHRTIPFKLATPSYELINLYWHDIDPSMWPGGWYVAALVTRDGFGNEGISPFRGGIMGNIPHCNPIHWKIITGR